MPDSYPSRRWSGEASKHPFYDLLPEYATIIALGESPPSQFAQLEAHLAQCAECQVDLDDLLELAIEAFSKHLEPPVDQASLELTVLRSILQPSPRQPWYRDRQTLVVFLSAPIFHAMHEQSLAGVPRGQLLYHYVQEPRSIADLEVSIDVYAEEARPGQGRVRVSVEVPSRDPMEQAGSLVVLRADEQHWDARTDELGLVDFVPVPLEALPRMRVEITPVNAE